MRASYKIFEKETEGLLIAIKVVSTGIPNGKQRTMIYPLPLGAFGGKLPSLVHSWWKNVVGCVR